MNIKKVGAVVGSISLLASLAASVPAFAQQAKAAPAHHAKKPIVIGFVPGVTTDPFFISMQFGAQQEAKALGVKLVYEGGEP